MYKKWENNKSPNNNLSKQWRTAEQRNIHKEILRKTQANARIGAPAFSGLTKRANASSKPKIEPPIVATTVIPSVANTP